MKIDTKGVVAIMVVTGCFGLIAPYVFRGQPPDALVLAFVTGALMLVLGWYFGHANGTQTALATAATLLATQATEKRAATAAVIASALPGPTPIGGDPSAPA